MASRGVLTRRVWLAGAGALVVGACSAPEAPRPTPSTGTPRPTRRSAGVVGAPRELAVRPCPAAAPALESQIQGEALAPRCHDGAWVFELPATQWPTDRRRSEAWLIRPRGQRTYRAGERAAFDLRIRGSLGDAAESQEDWQSLWQLHGPTAGVWKGPAVALMVRQGSWFITGGTGHPDHDDISRSYRWEQRLGPYRDGAQHRLRLAVALSPDVRRGTVDARLDDERPLRGYRPLSATGLAPGTMYPGQPVVTPRIGIYRGTLSGGLAPTYAQSVATSAVVIS